jgi:hypothetical protein
MHLPAGRRSATGALRCAGVLRQPSRLRLRQDLTPEEPSADLPDAPA